jgi:DNA-binding Xre family transcriptional regulator
MVSDAINRTVGGGIVVTLTIAAYLKKLEAEEAAKPPRDRREVPSVADLAEAAGVSRGAMYNLVNGQVKLVNLDLLSSIINELRQRGFDAYINDLLTTFPAEAVR